MTKNEKREYAFLLYKSNEHTQQEIADKVGMHLNSICRWKKEDRWDEIAETLLTTRHEQLRRMYMQLKELNDHIMDKPERKRFANKSEADTMIQITRSIASLEKDISIGVIIDVFMPFLKFVSKFDGELAKRIIKLQDDYIKSIL